MQNYNLDMYMLYCQTLILIRTCNVTKWKRSNNGEKSHVAYVGTMPKLYASNPMYNNSNSFHDL